MTESWRENMTKHLRGLQKERPQMPMTAHLGFMVGVLYEGVVGGIAQFPIVRDFADGAEMGAMSVKIGRANRLALKEAEVETGKILAGLAASVPV
mgnify:CR=1 FL=1